MVVPSHADIYLVGLGIFEMRQITVETLDVLRQAKRIFHLSSKHEELTAINVNIEDLGPLYWKSGKTIDIYEDLARHVVSFAQQARPTVFAIEGNPMLFSDLSWKIAELGKAACLRVEALPGVSCVDVLPIQLGFEPGDLGLQIFEATQLALYRLEINPYLSTLILQVGEFGERSLPRPARRRLAAFTPLVRHLSKFFPVDHPAIFIRSAFSSKVSSVVFATEIDSIDKHQDQIVPGMTLYVPRIGIPPMDEKLREELGLS
ncbi:MAG: hypothetical protein HY647_12875 [Acidobacteria bacterium]|nr:hypothetical protein [Acidobacteriota bacterium]